jgi:two-component system, response regulator
MMTKTVLSVEDNQDDTELVRLALKKGKLRCNLDVVVDGVELADYLFGVGKYQDRDARQMPDLILLDLKLPKIDGCQSLQMLHRVRGQPDLPPVVVLTSSDDKKDIADAYRAGANSYIRKPVDFSQFITLVGQVFAYWLELNVPVSTGRTTLRGQPTESSRGE